MVNTQDMQCGRMFQGPSPRTKAKTSGASSKRSSGSSSRTPRCLRLTKHDGLTPTFTWETDGALLTEFLMLNTGESPSDARESSLSQILQAEVPEKYYLSAKACQGILRRAAERGKELPEVLQKALERQAAENHPTGGRVKIEEDGKAQTLTSRMGTGDNNNTVDRHAVWAMTTGSFTQVEKGTSPTIMARDYKDPNAVCMGRGYTVRLTPTECARLQGFPDWWCSDLGTENPTTDELSFWRDVFDAWTNLTGKKQKTDKQIIKWLKNPHSDSAEYKMWGNGVALPCVEFVLGGIARKLKEGII